ncbi:MAG: Eco29kI family restriction endonuclease [Egibacteraceae bacterium]
MPGGDEYPHPEPYNPLSEVNLARAIREELERQPIHQLLLQAFWGAGLYALYYVGDLPLYEGVNDPACVTPIYVGKAAAGRSSYGVFIEGSKTRKLLNRVHDHLRSIEEAHTNLSLMDFRVRYLVTSDVHIVLGEAGLLQAYAPVLWNTVVTGFGINQPGAGRTGQRKSRWDTLHPGRPRAEGRELNEKSVEELTAMVRKAIEARANGGGVAAGAVADEADVHVDFVPEEI